MEQWKQLRRRSTGLWARVGVPSLPRGLVSPSPSSTPSSSPMPQAGAVRATWEPIDDLPCLPRAAHSLDVVAGAAYLFGGEPGPGVPASANHVHVVGLPCSSAGADYHVVEAVAAAGGDGDGDARGRDAPAQRDLQDVPLDEERPPASEGRDSPPAVPPSRAGHANAVIGARVFLFGGRGGPDMAPLQEAGRVWVFDTRSRA